MIANRQCGFAATLQCSAPDDGALVIALSLIVVVAQCGGGNNAVRFRNRASSHRVRSAALWSFDPTFAPGCIPVRSESKKKTQKKAIGPEDDDNHDHHTEKIICSNPPSFHSEMHCYQLISLLVALVLTLSTMLPTVEARAHYHRKRALQEDYEYRDTSDYTDNSGVFVDSVPVRTTPFPKHLKNHQRTNRFPKLRKFFEERYFQ